MNSMLLLGQQGLLRRSLLPAPGPTPSQGGRYCGSQFAASQAGPCAVPLDSLYFSKWSGGRGAGFDLHPFHDGVLPSARSCPSGMISFIHTCNHSCIDLFVHSLIHSTTIYEVSALCLTLYWEQRSEQNRRPPTSCDIPPNVER